MHPTFHAESMPGKLPSASRRPQMLRIDIEGVVRGRLVVNVREAGAPELSTPISVPDRLGAYLRPKEFENYRGVAIVTASAQQLPVTRRGSADTNSSSSAQEECHASIPYLAYPPIAAPQLDKSRGRKRQAPGGRQGAAGRTAAIQGVPIEGRQAQMEDDRRCQ